MRKVIFVGGTAYSGSTLFDLTLGNDVHGFSCREVSAYFRPFRPHHVAPVCGCGDPQCGLWREIKAGGEEQLYQTILDRLPNVEFIVDSSKDPLWIRSQVRNLARQRIETKHILIWKTPLEMAASWAKRGHSASWERAWVSYHQLCTRWWVTGAQ